MSSLPQLPRHRELVTQLVPIHARLSFENSIAKRHPVYKCSEVQVFTDFLNSFVFNESTALLHFYLAEQCHWKMFIFLMGQAFGSLLSF